MKKEWLGKMIHILHVDDHPSVALGMKLMLEKEGDFQVESVTSGKKALKLIKERTFDIFIFDLKMPEMNGHELAEKVIEINREAKILIYTGYEITPYFNELFTSGVVGFLSKTDTEEQIIQAIRSILDNNAIIPIPLISQLREIDLKSANSFENPLNEEEMKLLRYIGEGKTTKEIADVIHKSTRTIEYQLTKIFKKLNVNSRKEAVKRIKEFEGNSTRH